MKKRDLLRRIAELERRVAELEAAPRPLIMPVIEPWKPTVPIGPWTPTTPTVPYYPPIITCGETSSVSPNAGSGAVVPLNAGCFTSGDVSDA